MFNLDNWKEPIDKKDLISVLINGLLTALLIGALAGSLDYLFSLIRFPISMGLVICTLAVGTRIKKGYIKFHILYPVLSIVFLLIALFVTDLAELMLLYRDIELIGHLLSRRSFYSNFILSPIHSIINGFEFGSFLTVVLGVINLGIYCWSFYYCFKLAKGKK